MHKGKTYFLLYLFILRLAKGEPFLLEWNKSLFLVDEKGALPGKDPEGLDDDDIWVLVDGDSMKSDPHLASICYHQFRIIEAMTPQSHRDQKWLERLGGRIVVMCTWSWQELFVVGYLPSRVSSYLRLGIDFEFRLNSSHFLERYDLAPKRLARAVEKFGHNARKCFQASRGLRHERSAIIAMKGPAKVNNIFDLLVRATKGDFAAQALFEINPPDGDRDLYVDVRPVSTFAIDLIIERQSAQSLLASYNAVKSLKPYAAVSGELLERAFHAFLTTEDGRQFTIRSLDDGTLWSIKITSDIKSGSFGSTKTLDRHAIKRLADGKACYLKPLSRTRATVDAILLLPAGSFKAVNPPGQLTLTGPLFMLFVFTRGTKHSVKPSGLRLIQSAFYKAPGSSLRPTQFAPWHIVFAVPPDLASRYKTTQPIQELDGVSDMDLDLEDICIFDFEAGSRYGV